MGALLGQYEAFDTHAVVTVSYVDPPKKGWWKVSDSQQRICATNSPWVAALADTYRIKGWKCKLITVAGFPNPRLVGVERVETV